ncbi:MAG: PIN domain-containing protein [Acidobacteria bacterium]|nr:MAG: PIN domain-containing protein [Acidobacteriota bacterium]
MIVVDANIIVYYCLPGPQNEAAKLLSVVEPDWQAPALWRSELRNVLAGKLRHGMAMSAVLDALSDAERCIADTHEADSRRVMELAATTHCTAYDLEYAALALQLHVDLVTMDTELLRAFPEIARPLV